MILLFVSTLSLVPCSSLFIVGDILFANDVYIHVLLLLQQIISNEYFDVEPNQIHIKHLENIQKAFIKHSNFSFMHQP
jgi:hypothetical protein